MHKKDFKKNNIQVSVMSSGHMDLVVVYKSPVGNDSDLRQLLEAAISTNHPTLVCGDLNMCFIDSKTSKSISFLRHIGFQQLVQEATHIDGGHIDHVYVLNLQANIELYSPYYTAKDHDGLLITVKDDKIKGDN